MLTMDPLSFAAVAGGITGFLTLQPIIEADGGQARDVGDPARAENEAVR